MSVPKSLGLVIGSSIFLAACSHNIVQVSDSGFGAFEADLAILDSATVAVAWYDTRHDQAEIYVRLLDTNLVPVSSEFRLTSSETDSFEADIVGYEDLFAVAWYEVAKNGAASVRLGLWDRSGSRLWERTISEAGIDARIPVVESVGDKLFLSWLQSSLQATNNETVASKDLMGMWLDPEQPDVASAFRIGLASPTTWNINLAVAEVNDGPAMLVVYDAEYETRASEIYLLEVVGELATGRRLTADDGFASKYPDVAVSGDMVGITWFDNSAGNNDVFFATGRQAEFSQQSALEILEQRGARLTESGGDSIGAYLAWLDDLLLVAWSEHVGGRYQVLVEVAGSSPRVRQQISQGEADSFIPSIDVLERSLYSTWNDVTANRHEDEGNLSRSEVFASRIDYDP